MKKHKAELKVEAKVTGRRPVIGIPYGESVFRDEAMRRRTYVTRKYFVAIQNAGGMSVLLPPDPSEEVLDHYMKMVDALMFPGGEDIDPRHQNEDPHKLLGDINPLRDQFELDLARMAWRLRKPSLGICRGIQVMAVALGGSVWQDISDVALIKHSQAAPRWATTHKISIKKDSRLFEWLKEKEVFTNSFHHQSVRDVPKGMRISAKTSDGIIEAIESIDDRVFVGVQWHPEELFRCDRAASDLFSSFVESI